MSDALKKREQQLLRRGLGTGLPLFPGLPTLDSAGLSFDSPKRKIGEISQGILKGLGKGANFIQTLTAPDGITKNVTDPAVEYLKSPSSMEIAKKKNEIAQNEKMKENIKNLSLNELFYPDSKKSMGFDPVDVTAQNENIIKIENELGALEENDLTKQIKNLIAPSGVEDSSEAQKIITEDKAQRLKYFIDKEAEIADAQGKPKVGGEALQKAAAAAEDAFAGGVQQYANDAGINIPTTPNMSKEESLEKYKQEFANATGIDVSGKVDKSSALMAMGLALMQNRAGKGFNVGRLLSSVGEAGEKALPALEKAKSEAKQAQLAAGKYALDQIKAGESAEAAFAKEVRTNTFNWELKKMELEEKARIEKIKNSGKSNEMKNVAPISIGAGDLKVTVGDVDGVSKFANGPTDAGKIVNAYTKYTEGQENIDVMGDALTAIANQDSSAISILANRAKSLGVAWGIVDGKDMFGEKGISDEAEFEKYRQATINAFKKLILQESQVSNLDLTTLFASFGEVSFMKNPEEARAAIDLMDQYFAAKKRSLEPVINDFGDRDWFRSDKDFERTQTKLELLGKAYKEEATQDDSGRLKLNISTIPKLKNKEENS